MLPGATDRLFLHFCRTGSARSLGKVFDRTAPELLRVALYLSGDRTDADDLVQRTFLAAIESRATYDPTRRAMPWLLGILANHARRLQRERATRRAVAPPAPGAADDPATAASNRELAERIARLRAELGAPYAEVLGLHLEQGLNAKEIAERLGRPAGTVRTQLMRALERMRQHLPSGFVGGLLPPLPGFAELLAMKGSVLAANHTALAAGAATGAVAIATGGSVMTKKLIAVTAGLLLLAAGVYTAWPGGDAAPPMPPASKESARTSVPPVLQGTVVDAAASGTPSSRQPAAAIDPDEEPGFGALRVLVRWQDGRPAAGIGVRAEGLSAARNDRRIATTGADGSCLLPHLRPAPWQIAITHADGTSTIEVQAGPARSCELTARSVATVRGRVVDEQERPVADAAICIAPSPHECEFAVGVSGDDGSFAVPLAAPVHIGARKAGFTHSLALAVDPERSVGDLVLALRGAGGRVEGTVRDAQGQPVAWARVGIGMQRSRHWSFNGPYERERYAPAGAQTWTDRQGRFAVAGVEPGKEFVQAWAPGYAVAGELVEVTTGVSTCNLTLLAGAVVQGLVRDADGNPVADAAIGPAMNQAQFVELWTSSGVDGRYRLVDAHAGRWDIQASSEIARAAETIEVQAGQTAEWNPVLRRVTEIRGRLFDASDRAMVAVTVSIGGENSPPGGPSAVTDADGAFVLQPAVPGAVDLRIGDGQLPALKYVRRVRPGAKDLVIRLSAADQPSAHLRGRIVDAGGAPITATVMAIRGRESQCYCAETTAGRFQLGPLPPGTFRVRLTTPLHGSRALPEVVLQAHGEHDFGELVLQMPGSATCDVRDEQGSLTRAFVMLYDRDGEWVASMNTEQGRATFPALQPGHYFVTCGGAPRAARADLEVQGAARAHADLQMAMVGHADVVVRDPLKATDLELSALAFTGGRFAGLFGNTRGAGKVRVWLPPGSYTVEVRSRDGRRARGEVAIRGLDDHPEVQIDLPAK